jgi:hypothetical protein
MTIARIGKRRTKSFGNANAPLNPAAVAGSFRSVALFFTGPSLLSFAMHVNAQCGRPPYEKLIRTVTETLWFGATCT